MKALAIIEIDENHQFTEINNLYDRLQGYKAELVPVPSKKTELEVSKAFSEKKVSIEAVYFASGWNACVDEILGEENE